MSELAHAAVYGLTNLLLWPVVILLLVAVAHSAYLAGEALVEWFQRRGRVATILDLENIPEPMRTRQGVREWQRQRAADPQADQLLLLDRTEAALTARSDRSRLWVRLGPALGLGGTLIPLGPALVALSRNDLVALSNGLVLAFGDTVLGIVAGGVSWLVLAAQRRWYRFDLAELSFAVDRAAEVRPK